MELVEVYNSTKHFSVEKDFFQHQIDTSWLCVLKELDLYYDLRQAIALVMKSLIFKEYDSKYEMLVCDGNWVDLNQVSNPASINFTSYQHITEISFAHAGIEPFDYFGLADELPNLQYLDLFGNESSKNSFIPFDNHNTTLYLNKNIVVNYGLYGFAFPVERTRNMRLLEGMMRRNDVLNSPDMIEMVFIYDGKHVCPAKKYEFVNFGTRYLFLKGCEIVFARAQYSVYWVYPSNGRIILKLIGKLFETTRRGRYISLEDEEFNFSKED